MPAPEVAPRHTPEPHIGLASDGLVVLPDSPSVDQRARARVPRIVPVAMVLGLVAVACAPAAAKEQPGSQVNLPIVGKEAPSEGPQGESQVVVSSTATAEKKLVLPPDTPNEVQMIFVRMEDLGPKFTAPTVAQKYQEMLHEAATYKDPTLPPAIQEGFRGGKYSDVFSQLVGQYYATRDPEILALAKQVRDFIKEKYPAFYQSREWDIQ